MNNERKLLFLVNPHAGKAAIRGKLLSVLEVFSQAGYRPTVCLSRRSGELTEVARQEAEQYDLVVCSGGDGTLNETVNGLMALEHPPVLGYIPAGTTNDFATSLGIPKQMEKAAAIAVSGRSVQVDVGRFNGRYFSYVAAFGAFTDVTYATPQEYKNVLGKLAYLLEGAQRLGSLKSWKVRVEYDTGCAEGEFLLGLVSNSSYVAGLPVGKVVDVSMTDGLMEVGMVRKPANLADLSGTVKSLLQGELDNELILSVKTRRLRLVSEEPMPWTLDGEYGGTQQVAQIENLPRALTIHSPEHLPAVSEKAAKKEEPRT